MRIRKKKYTKERIEKCATYLCKAPEQYKGKWHTIFGNTNPIHIEIGCGKGKFITELAAMHPNINFIAIEKCSDVLVLALEKAQIAQPTNLMFLSMDAILLSAFFAQGEISQIYIQFCDPWHKKRHEKRRLTYKGFLDIYKNIMVSEGKIIFKTDNRPLFDFSIASMTAYGMTLRSITMDLHSSGLVPKNVMTEYEQLFFESRISICYLEATFS